MFLLPLVSRPRYVTFINNTQTDNPVLPDGTVVKNPPTNHRLEGLTLDGGGGAYTGGVASATATSVTLAQQPYGKGTGAYIKDYNVSSWTGAAIAVLSGRGAGQWRRVVGVRGPRGAQRLWDVDAAWDVEPDTSSQVSAAGRALPFTPLRRQNVARVHFHGLERPGHGVPRACV